MKHTATVASLLALFAAGAAQAQDAEAAQFRDGFLAGEIDWSAVEALSLIHI